jgi:hypothetical protein
VLLVLNDFIGDIEVLKSNEVILPTFYARFGTSSASEFSESTGGLGSWKFRIC